MREDAPVVLFEPCIARTDGDGIAYQAGAFRRRADAEAVLAIWREEGRHDPSLLSINHVTLFADVDSWLVNR